MNLPIPADVDAGELMKFARRVANPLRRPPGVSFEDAVNDVVAEALRLSAGVESGRYSVPPTVSPEAWLVVRVRGVLRDRYGRAWRDHYAIRCVGGGDADIVDDRTIPVPAETAQTPDVTCDVEDALSTLTEDQQSVARLVLIEGYSQADVARMRGKSEASVSKILTRAKARLRESLAAYSEA